MKTLRHFCLLLTGILLVALTACKKNDSDQGNTNISQGNRVTSIANVWNGTINTIRQFHYSGDMLDSITYQGNLDHSYYVWRNSYAGGSLKKVSLYQLADQKFKPLAHFIVLEYANGVPVKLELENYNNQDTVVVRIIFRYTYNSQGLITGFSKSYLEGSSETPFSQTDITYDVNLRKQLRTYSIPNPTGGIMRDDYTWSGNELAGNVKTYVNNSDSTNYRKYAYVYENNRVGSYTFYEGRSHSWEQIYTTTYTYNGDGNISEEIITPSSSAHGVVTDLKYTYTQGIPLYRSFILVSNPEWPLDSPVIPSAP